MPDYFEFENLVLRGRYGLGGDDGLGPDITVHELDVMIIEVEEDNGDDPLKKVGTAQLAEVNVWGETDVAYCADALDGELQGIVAHAVDDHQFRNGILRREEPCSTGRFVALLSLRIDAAYRGRGIGTATIDRLTEHFRPSCRAILLRADPYSSDHAPEDIPAAVEWLLNYYRYLGFEPFVEGDATYLARVLPA